MKKKKGMLEKAEKKVEAYEEARSVALNEIEVVQEVLEALRDRVDGGFEPLE